MLFFRLVGILMCGGLLGCLQAQEVDYSRIDVRVYLADGSLYNGHFISSDRRELTMELLTGDTLVIPFGIITHHKVLDNTRKEFFNKGRYHFQSGTYFGISSGYGAEHTSLQFQLGERITPRLSAGLSTGYMYYVVNPFSRNDYNILPLAGFLEYALLHRGTRIVGALHLGYGFMASERFANFQGNKRGGLFCNPNLKFHFASKGLIKFHLGLGTNVQHVRGDYTFNQFNQTQPVHVIEKIWFIRPVFKWGMTFN